MPNENTVKLTPEQQALVTQWMGLPMWALNKHPGLRDYLVERIGEDEVKSLAFLGLVLAARGYDPTRIGKNGKPTAFSTYATRCVIATVLRHSRRPSLVTDAQGEEKKVYLFRNNHDLTEILGETLVDESTNEAELVSEAEAARDHVNLILSHLHKRDAYVLRARKLQGLTLAQVGEKLGVSRERASQIQRRAMEEFEAVAVRLKHLRND